LPKTVTLVWTQGCLDIGGQLNPVSE